MAFKSREQIEAEAPEIIARQVAAAEAGQSQREKDSRKLVVVTLVEAPRERFAGNQKVVAFSGTEAGRTSPLSGVYFVPEHEARGGFASEDLDARLGGLKVGDKLSMAGYWAKRKWKGQDGSDRESWEFKAQNFAKGDVSLDDMRLEARARIGDARLETLPLGEEMPDRSAATSRPAASPTLTYATGDIVADRAQVLVNTVNSQLSEHGNPVMGKGVALAFKERFPSIMRPYGDAIRSGELKPGRAILMDLPDGRKWAALATKDHFRDSSRMEWVEAGLKELGERMRAEGLTSVALPPPGCGNGGLDWKQVEPLVHRHLAGLDVSMYAKPSGAMEPAQQQAAGRQSPQVDAGKAKSLSAFGAEPQQSGTPREWTKAELLAAIPSLLRSSGGYDPYAGIGSRETPQDVADHMTAAARVLESRGFTLRSGFAGGADTAFELGTKRDDLREIFAPWKGFGQNPDSPKEKQRWDQIRRHEGLTGERFVPAKPILLDAATARRAEEMAARFHPAWDRLGSGPRALMSRNGAQALGKDLDVPAKFEIAYTVDGKATGGTGQAIRMASSYGIPVLNMHDPDIRAAVLKELGIGWENERSREVAGRAREDHRDRYEGGSMSAALRDRTREDTHAFKQGEAPSRSAAKAPEAVPGEFDLGTPPVRSRHKDDVASFCKVADPLGSLSNMFNKAPLTVDGVQWKSSEALYQALRFPAHPELQEAIRNESNAYTAKVLAHENKHLTRPDWNDVNHQAMAYVLTLKEAQSEVFRKDLYSTGGRDIVELSVKDDHWGAKPRGDQLVGHDVLGHQLTQLREGARMHEPPEGSLLLGRPIGVTVQREKQVELPEPSIKASMYFNFGGQRREGIESTSTFEAINAGERTSTTRFPAWGPLERWEKLEPGSVVRFYEDKDMRGKSVDVVVTGTSRIDLARASADDLREWSKAEGWSEKAGRDFGGRYGEGVQIRYALPDSPEGRRALGLEVSRDAAPARSVSNDRTPSMEPVRSAAPAARQAAMSAKQQTLALFG